MWKKRIVALALCLCMIVPGVVPTVFAEDTVAYEGAGETMSVPACDCGSTLEAIYQHSGECTLKKYYVQVANDAESVDALYASYITLEANGQQCILDYLKEVNYTGHAKEGWYDALVELVNGGGSEEPTLPENPFEEEIPSLYDVVDGQAVVVYSEAFPERATLNLSAVDGSAQMNAFGISKEAVFAYDIKVLQEDSSEWQPGESSVAVQIPVNAGVGTAIGILHTHEGKTTYLGTTTVKEDGTIVFVTDGFSEFVGFTVDFHYNGVDYSIAGESSILLSELFVKLNIPKDAKTANSVVFSDTSLVKVERQEDGDWLLTSLVAFSTNETLVIAFEDGEALVIEVTDEQYDYDVKDGNTYDVGWWNLDSEANWHLHINRDNLPLTIYLTRTIGSGGWNYKSGKEYISTSENNRKLTVKFASYIPLGMEVVDIDVNIGGRVYISFFENISVTYNSGSVSASNMPSNSTVKTYGTITLSSTTPTATGYTFSHWLGSDGKTYNPGATVTVDGDVTFTAQWTANTYTATFNANGGSVSPTSKTFNIESALSLPTPTYTGYTFTGWKITSAAGNWTNDANYSSSTTYIAAGKYGNVTLSAQWSMDSYNIGYNLAGGTVKQSNPTSYNVKTESFTLNNPTKTGYTFTGWTGSNGSTPQTSVSIVKGSTGNKDYTANWDATSYAITYNLDGGINHASNPSSYTIENTVTLQEPTKNGYTFIGWTGSNGSTPQKSVTIAVGSTEAKSYIANWEKETYTITYAGLDGATITENPTSYNVDTPSFALNNPTKAGYTFAGWTGTGLNSASTNVTVAMGSTGNRSYTATWTKDTYTITYTGLDGATVIGNPTSYAIDSETFSLNAPTKDGYTFLGWSGTGLNGSENKNVTIEKGSTGNREYTAHWSAITYDITYVLNGGTNHTSNPKTYTPDNTVTLQQPTKAGYTFVGWTGSNGTNAQASVTIAKGSIGDKNYEAHWTPINYTITYDLDGGSVDGTNPISYTIETDNFTLINPTKKGYTFAGWTGTDLEDSSKTVTIKKGSNGNRSYAATWTKDNYDIIYHLDGGTVTGSNPVKYAVDSENITLINPTKKGYTFKGWTGTELSDATEYVNIPTGSVGNREYTAVWEIIEYSIIYELNGATTTPNNPTKYTVESGAITLENPYKTDYKFIGWTGADLADKTMSVTIPKGSIGNRTYIANWELDVSIYTIEYYFEDFNGNFVKDASKTYTSEKVLIGSAITDFKNGYFEGFTYSHTASEPEQSNFKVLANDATVIKNYYSRNSYKITWVLNYPDKTVATEDMLQYGASIIQSPDVSENYLVKVDWVVTVPSDKYLDVPLTMPAEDITLTRELEFNGGSLTITKTGMDAGKSTVFTVSGDNLATPIIVTIEGNGSVTFNYLPTGTYTVTEEAWSWEYTCSTQDTQPVTIAKGQSSTIAFSNTKKNSGWLSGESRANNKFKAVIRESD